MNRLMERIIYALILITALALVSIPVHSQDLDSELEHIGSVPTVISANHISSGLHEHSALDLSPNGNYAIWTISLSGHKIILQINKSESGWTKSEVASFSGQYRDEYHFFSPTGDTVFFMSYRPKNVGGAIQKHFIHWMATNIEGKWTEPMINYDFHKELWAYSMGKNQSVYGWCNLDTTKQDADIYYQKYINGKYTKPELLSDSINSEAIEYCPCISPDGSYLVFGRMGTGNEDGLYISYKKEDNSWTNAKRLTNEVNQGYAERFPKISPDGKVLFFNRQLLRYTSFSEQRLNYRDVMKLHLSAPLSGNGDIWGVSTDVLKDVN